jgi:exonuclease VII small subunit
MWKDVRTQAPPTMSTYSQAMDKFTKSATAFMENVHHLTQARTAYEEAMQASTAIRASLDAGDQALRSLMKQLQEALNVHVGGPAPDRKGPEAVRVEVDSKAVGEGTPKDKALA